MADLGGEPDDPGPVVAVGEYVVDFAGYEVRRAGTRIPTEPQVIDVVRHLLRRAGRVVTKEELLDGVWRSRFVSESALTSRIKTARRVLGDDGTRQSVIQTVHGRGYKWIAPFVVVDGGASSRATQREAAVLAPRRTTGVGLPTPLTAFVGRGRESAALDAALAEHRLVTATGPGGVGKTRLALAVAAAAAPRYPDGVAFAGLTAVSEDEMVLDAVAASVGVVEGSPADRREALVRALADRRCLILLDNCEHVVTAVRALTRELLVGCPEVRILATSRIRLMLTFEHVFPVPGLAVAETGAETGAEAGAAPGNDAVELFVARMTDAGEPAGEDEATTAAIASICRSLHGLALAIELAAARAPSIGLDGLRDALVAPLALLSVGHTGSQRHDSLRAAIDWSYRLLEREDQATLRAAATFVAPFTADAVGGVIGVPGVLISLARLVDWNLVERRAATGRFRMLESIRHFALEQAELTGESDRLRSGHLGYVRGRLAGLEDGPFDDLHWCDRVDLLLPDSRAALLWAAEDPAARDACGFADLLARVTFQRGRPAEAQTRYEDAARWASAPRDRHRWMCAAAGAATSRNVGGDALRLLAAAADVALEAGEPDQAALDLASAAALRNRASGIIGQAMDADATERLLQRARDLATGADARTRATLAMAESWRPDATIRGRASVEHALELARSCGDAVLENICLDLWTVVALDTDDLEGAIRAIRTRVALLEPIGVDAFTGFEFFDAHQMACRLEIARGDFHAARVHANAVARLPFVREERHLGLGRRMEVDALAGEFEAAFAASDRFRQDWQLAGRPRASNLAVGCYAVSTAYGLVGDEEQRAAWVDLTTALFSPGTRALSRGRVWAPVLDALVDLDRDDPERALGRLGDDPDDDPTRWSNPNHRVWRSWYAALWAEASVLAGLAGAEQRIARAAPTASVSGFAHALVDRARFLRAGDTASVRAVAARFERLGAVYQAARSIRLAG